MDIRDQTGFKRVKEPLVDVFKEAEEVRIIIDLGSFRRGEIDIDIKPNKYIITAIHGKEVFKEEIALPEDVDIDNTEEHFKNGILELVLPKKRSVNKGYPFSRAWYPSGGWVGIKVKSWPVKGGAYGKVDWTHISYRRGQGRIEVFKT